jgi:hypothetical protein
VHFSRQVANRGPSPFSDRYWRHIFENSLLRRHFGQGARRNTVDSIGRRQVVRRRRVCFWSGPIRLSYPPIHFYPVGGTLRRPGCQRRRKGPCPVYGGDPEPIWETYRA